MKSKTIAIKGKIVVGEHIFEIAYLDNPTSQSLLEQMPFSTVLEDFAGKEKIFQPKKQLSREKAPAGAKPMQGDIMCYAPWGNVAIFYGDAAYAAGLIPMGRIEDVDAFINALRSYQARATFEKE